MCQQFLALGTVVAIIAPASSVVTLDIVAPGSSPVAEGATTHHTAQAGGALVAASPVVPTVTEIPMRGIDPKALEQPGGRNAGSHRTGLSLTGADALPSTDGLAALTAPEPVSGLATVGVTWKHGVTLAEKDIKVSVRTFDNGAWSSWQHIPYDAEHGPDPGSAEARRARPGTDPVVVGKVADVQVRAVTATGTPPPDMKLALVNPGKPVLSRVEHPAIDTARLASAATLAGTPEHVTAKPKIFSRAQWGADESMRDPSSLHYGVVHAGFVHHTVNANHYTRAQVPAIIRGIYAYHTQSNGWSDIGYNFLVDRFGRIWEGRYGGVDRPVVGAHTLGYNDDAFAMSAIGNYQIARPSAAMLDAYGRLFAWKLALHGVNPTSTHQWVTSRYFQAINGHRDANPTECPGKYLYAQLPTIRKLAAAYQRPFTSRKRSANVAGAGWPDLVVRDRTTKRAYVVRTGGQTRFAAGVTAATGWGGMDLMAATRDVTGDGKNDMVARNAKTKVTSVHPGDGAGHFGSATHPMTRFASADQLVAVGDLDGDGNNDLLARRAGTRTLSFYAGQGDGTFAAGKQVASSWPYNRTVGVGDLTGDGRADVLARGSSGRLWLFAGNGKGGLGKPVQLPGRWGGFDLVAGMGDATNDGTPDLLVRSAATKLTYVYPGNGKGGLGTRYGPFGRFSHVDYFSMTGQVRGSRRGDIVGRNGAGSLVVFANNGAHNLGRTTDTGRSFAAGNLILDVGDWNGDGYGDVMTRSKATGALWLHEGDGSGHFAGSVRAGRRFGSVHLLAAVGDMTGDGFPDLMGQPAGGSMRIYPGNGRTGFRASYVAHSGITANAQLGVGLWNHDGSPDSLLRRSNGDLQLFPGNGPGGLLSGRRVVATGTRRYDWLEGAGDVDGNGTPDVIARSRATGRLWLLPGDGGGFGPRRFLADGFGRYDLIG